MSIRGFEGAGGMRRELGWTLLRAARAALEDLPARLAPPSFKLTSSSSSVLSSYTVLFATDSQRAKGTGRARSCGVRRFPGSLEIPASLPLNLLASSPPPSETPWYPPVFARTVPVHTSPPRPSASQFPSHKQF